MNILRVLVMLIAGFGLVACESSSTEPTNDYGYNVKAFRIRPHMVDDIRERHLETINSVRFSQGLPALEYAPALDAAALRQAESINVQQRAWHFGQDGSSPLDRIQQAGFTGPLIGENVSETFEDDQVTLQAWLRDPNSRSVILDPNARYVGLAWSQEGNAKLWWVQVVGGAGATILASN